MISQACAYLLVDKDRLHLLEKRLRFGQLQAERVDRQHVAIDLRHLVHGCPMLVIVVVLRFDDYLHP